MTDPILLALLLAAAGNLKPWERALVDRFVCPRCGAKNTPKITVIHLGRSGDARCSHCGKEDAARGFLPDEEREP